MIYLKTVLLEIEKRRRRVANKSCMMSMKINLEKNLLGEPSIKFDYYVKYTPPPINDKPIIPVGWDGDDDCNQLHKNGTMIIAHLHLHK